MWVVILRSMNQLTILKLGRDYLPCWIGAYSRSVTYLSSTIAWFSKVVRRVSCVHFTLSLSDVTSLHHIGRFLQYVPFGLYRRFVGICSIIPPKHIMCTYRPWFSKALKCIFRLIAVAMSYLSRTIETLLSLLSFISSHTTEFSTSRSYHLLS